MLSQTDLSTQIILDRITGLHEDVNDLRQSTKDSMREIATAINQLVRIEERQTNTTESFVKMSLIIEKMEVRLRKVEDTEQIQKLTSKWVLTGVWTVAGAALLFIAKAVAHFFGVPFL